MPINVIERGEARHFAMDEEGVRTFQRQWIVESTDVAIDETTALAALNLADPTTVLYGRHPAWPFARRRGITCRGSKNARQWTVEATYSTASFKAAGLGGLSGLGSGTAGDSTSPTDLQSQNAPANQRPPTITIRGRDKTKVLEYDAVNLNSQGKPSRILNVPIGDPFNPPPEVLRSGEVINFKFFRHPSELNWATRRLYRNSINDKAVTILGASYPAHSLRCADYTLDTVWEAGAADLELFFALSVDLIYDQDLWDVVILNTGRRQKITVLGVDLAVAIVDGNGQPTSEPVPIDNGTGLPVAAGTDPANFPYLTQNGYVPKDWAKLLA